MTASVMSMFQIGHFNLTVYNGRRRDEREAGCCLRQAQAASLPAASALAEHVEAREDTAPPTVLTLAAQGQDCQVRLKHALPRKSRLLPGKSPRELRSSPRELRSSPRELRSSPRELRSSPRELRSRGLDLSSSRLTVRKRRLTVRKRRLTVRKGSRSS